MHKPDPQPTPAIFGRAAGYERVSVLVAEYPVSRAKLYELAAEGKIRSKRLDRCLLIERASIDDYIASM